MLDDFFEKIDKLIEDKNSMPACDSNNAENQLYGIDRDSRTLSINNKRYLIPDFFNIENAINGDFKTLILNIASYIWNIIVFCIIFGISYAIGIFYLFNGIVPLLWIPYVTYKILKKDFKSSAILHCMIAPIVWNILLIVLFALAYKFAFLEKIVDILFFSFAGIVGGVLALFHTVANLFSEQAREEFLSGIKNV